MYIEISRTVLDLVSFLDPSAGQARLLRHSMLSCIPSDLICILDQAD